MIRDAYLRFNKSIIMLPAQILTYLENLKDKCCSLQLSHQSQMIQGHFIDFFVLENELFLKVNSLDFFNLQDNAYVVVRFENERIKFRCNLKQFRDNVLICELPSVLFNGRVYQRSDERSRVSNIMLLHADKEYTVKDISQDGIGIIGVLPCFINEKIIFKLKDLETGVETEKEGTIIHYTNDCTGIKLCQMSSQK